MLSRFQNVLLKKPNMYFSAMRFVQAPMRRFSAATDPAWNQSDDISQVPRFSLDAFYEDGTFLELTDEEAFNYMTFSANLAMVSFKDDAEMMSFKNDFQAALGFITKLDEVDTKGTEPLGNVLEHYGGNKTKVRVAADFRNTEDDQTAGLDFRSELKKLNKHVKDDYVVLNMPK